MDSSINSFSPTSILQTSVTTNIISWGLRIWHTLCALLSALLRLTSCTIWMTIWEWISSSWFNEGVRRKDQFYFPVCICSCQHLNFKVSVSVNILFLNKNWSSITHVSRWRSWKLIVMTVQLNCISFRWNWPSTKRKLFRVIRLPDFYFIDIRIWKTSLSH